MALEATDVVLPLTRCRFLHSADGLLMNCRFCEVLMWGQEDNAPMDCRQCSSFLACRKCYARMEAEQTWCACGLPITSQSYGLARTIIEHQKSLNVYCQHKDLGCNWRGGVDKQQEHLTKCAPLLLKHAREELEDMRVELDMRVEQAEQTTERNIRLIKEVKRLRDKLRKISALCDDGPGKKKRRREDEAGDFEEGCATQKTAPESPCYSPASPI